MKRIVVTLIFHLGCFCCVAWARKAPDGDPCIERKDPSSLELPIAGGAITEITDAIKGQTGALKVDLSKVDKAIQDWFDEKKRDPRFYDPLAAQWNSHIESTKTQARQSVRAIETEWNSKVSALETGLSASFESFTNAGPKALIEGNYAYCERFLEPGDPGWTLSDSITITPISRVKADASGGLSPVEVKASLGAVLAGAEVITSISSLTTLSITLSFPGDVKPDAANPTNKPIAETGFIPKLKGNLKISFEAHALITAGAALDVDANVTFPRIKGNIEAGKDLPE